MARNPWSAALAFAAGIALGWGARGCGGETAPAEPDGGRAAVPPPVATPVSRGQSREATRAGGTGAPAGSETAPSPPTRTGDLPDVREVPLPGAPTGFHEIEVEVVDADGAAAKDALDVDVYALPAGASGTFDSDCLSIVFDGSGGRFRLRLPSPGRFDVFARTQHLIAHAEDVTVPGTDSIRLALPRAPVATFVLDPESPPDGDVTFRVRPVPRPDARAFPGRGEPPSATGTDVRLGPGTPRVELALVPAEYEAEEYVKVPVAGQEHTFEHVAPERPARIEPRRFTPPATVRVGARVESPNVLVVTLSLKEAGPRVFADRTIPLRLEFGDDTEQVTARVHSHEKSSGGLGLRRDVRTRRGTLQWSGPSVVPGAAQWDLDVSPRLMASVEVRPPAAEAGLRVLVELGAEETPEDGRVDVQSVDADDPEETDHASVPVGEEVVLDVSGEWLLASVDPYEGSMKRRVAGPVRVLRGGRTVLRPRRGGYVVFAPTDVPPDGAGSFVVARTDGAPFSCDDQGSLRFCRLAEVDPGEILGPFEPGVVPLDVFVGSTLWGRYEVTVRENAWTTLTPRPFR